MRRTGTACSARHTNPARGARAYDARARNARAQAQHATCGNGTRVTGTERNAPAWNATCGNGTRVTGTERDARAWNAMHGNGTRRMRTTGGARTWHAMRGHVTRRLGSGTRRTGTARDARADIARTHRFTIAWRAGRATLDTRSAKVRTRSAPERAAHNPHDTAWRIIHTPGAPRELNNPLMRRRRQTALQLSRTKPRRASRLVYYIK